MGGRRAGEATTVPHRDPTPVEREREQREVDEQGGRGGDTRLAWHGGSRLVLVVSGGERLDGRRPVGAMQARVHDIGFRKLGFESAQLAQELGPLAWRRGGFPLPPIYC